MSLRSDLLPSHMSMPREPLTYEEFLEWCRDDIAAEWVDGRVFLMSPLSIDQVRIVRFLVMLMQHIVEFERGGIVLFERFQMYLAEQRRGREPDIVYLRPESMHRLRRTRVDGPADLVVEVVSADSVERDYADKLSEYERARVPEFWLVDPLTTQARFHLIGDDGRYRVAFAGSEGEYRSAALPRLAIRVEWLWRDPTPPILGVLRDLGILT